jgi:hypothetical protein
MEAFAMGKYESLGAFLQKQRTREVPKAQHHRAWWSNNAANNVMTKVWLNAGFESVQVDMEARKLVFRRVKTSEASGGFAEAAPKPYATKDGRHPARGALKGMVHIPPGVDLTEPADPEWADLVDKKYGPEVR